MSAIALFHAHLWAESFDDQVQKVRLKYGEYAVALERWIANTEDILRTGEKSFEESRKEKLERIEALLAKESETRRGIMLDQQYHATECEVQKGIRSGNRIDPTQHNEYVRILDEQMRKSDAQVALYQREKNRLVLDRFNNKPQTTKALQDIDKRRAEIASVKSKEAAEIFQIQMSRAQQTMAKRKAIPEQIMNSQSSLGPNSIAADPLSLSRNYTAPPIQTSLPVTNQAPVPAQIASAVQPSAPKGAALASADESNSTTQTLQAKSLPQKLRAVAASGVELMDALAGTWTNKVVTQAESLKAVLEDLGDTAQLNNDIYGAAGDAANAMIHQASTTKSERRLDEAITLKKERVEKRRNDVIPVLGIPSATVRFVNAFDDVMKTFGASASKP